MPVLDEASLCDDRKIDGKKAIQNGLQNAINEVINDQSFMLAGSFSEGSNFFSRFYSKELLTWLGRAFTVCYSNTSLITVLKAPRVV